LNVLILGLGSIGQRWARLLSSYENVKIFTHRRLNLSKTISQDLQSVSNENPETFYGITNLMAQKDLKNLNFEVIFICTPIAIHLRDLELSLSLNTKKIFVEKPLAHVINESDSNYLTQLIESSKDLKNFPKIVTGYQSRFHPVILRIKNLISSKVIGIPYFVRSEYGEWLPGMHPYEDYRDSHMANFNLGGGPATCLSHELDLIEVLFGEITSHSGRLLKWGVLETNVPDLVTIAWEVNSNSAFKISGETRMDFVSWPPTRMIEIFGSDGRLSFDWLTGILKVFSRKNGIFEEDFSSISRDKIFTYELEELMRPIDSKASNFSSLESAVRISKLASKYTVQY